MAVENEDDLLEFWQTDPNAPVKPEEENLVEKVLPPVQPGLNHERIRDTLVGFLKGDGGDCPCCGQIVKVYLRKLNTNMARFLIGMVKEYERTHQAVRHESIRTEKEGRDYSYITKWGLAETLAPSDGEDKKNSGLWKPTQKGIDFVYRRLTVPSHVFLYDNQIVGWGDEFCTIDDALGKKWSWTELMGSGA